MAATRKPKTYDTDDPGVIDVMLRRNTEAIQELEQRQAEDHKKLEAVVTRDQVQDLVKELLRAESAKRAPAPAPRQSPTNSPQPATASAPASKPHNPPQTPPPEGKGFVDTVWDTIFGTA